MTATEIIDFIANSTKKTPVKVYVKGEMAKLDWPEDSKVFSETHTGVVFGDWQILSPFLEKNAEKIIYYQVENVSRNSAIPLLDLKNISARIEPGALIRENVEIGKNAVIMMGAVINIGAEIGENRSEERRVGKEGRSRWLADN